VRANIAANGRVSGISSFAYDRVAYKGSDPRPRLFMKAAPEGARAGPRPLRPACRRRPPPPSSGPAEEWKKHQSRGPVPAPQSPWPPAPSPAWSLTVFAREESAPDSDRIRPAARPAEEAVGGQGLNPRGRQLPCNGRSCADTAGSSSGTPYPCQEPSTGLILRGLRLGSGGNTP